MYFTGPPRGGTSFGVKQDDDLAAKWLKRAADARIAPAEACCGILLRAGRGVEKDEKLSVTYLERAVAQAPWENDDDARCNLAVSLLMGIGVKKDEKRGKQLLSVAMKNGHPQAASLLERFDAPRTKAEYLAKLDEAIASDDDPELRKAAQWMKGMLESGRGKLVKSGGSGTGERANNNAKPKRVNPKKKKGRAAKPQVITVDCATL